MPNPIKYNIEKELPSIILILFTLVLSAVSYPNLNDQIVTHWNLAGEANGWSSKTFFLLFFPGLTIFIYGLFLALPFFDPKKENYIDFAETYTNFKTLLIGVLTAIYTISLLSNLGYLINIGKSVSLIIGAMMIAIGFMLKDIKSNWFVGIRTPWTMSSVTVWEKTHHISVYFFSIMGLSIIIAPYLSNPWNITIFILGTLQMILGVTIYSYLAYKKENNKK
ncbi:MAG: DUF1648 domain-containing protein [Candidatus Falkowbacteria bacterium]